MKYFKLLFADIVKRPSLYFFIFLIVFAIDRHHRFEASEDKNFGPFSGDVLEYYTFLPEYFLDYRQVDGINFETNKRTVGMAIMYAPSFLVGHFISTITEDRHTGYTYPYQYCIRWGSIIYCFLGLFFCRKNLLFFFKEPIVLVALVCIFFGTNLFYYTFSTGEFAHAYLFFLYSVFIYATLKWILFKEIRFILLIGFLTGFITLVRPTGIIILLIPLLFNISSLDDFIKRLKLFFAKKGLLFFAPLLFSIPLLFQLLVWKLTKGHFIYYSYGKERFFFNDPQILNFLVSIRKGWLVYTPIMVFSLIGILLSRKYLKEFFILLCVFFCLNVYILSSWWDWAYGGSFGCRALIESYALLIFPLAVFIQFVWEFNAEKKWLNRSLLTSVLVVFYLLIEFNIFQTWQYKYGRIHWSGMNWETYKYIFLKDITTEEANYLNTRYTPPDADEMLEGKRDE
ncbi:hypothetical protein [Aurantibacillus circumpalustris]|uniref:hypothetical protein n=1 Tax=Aurantibacillus circumpalustris TaxID=3036359 RepID=UPI00295B3E7E|nr:hypothetical protein [Aurantibacillus circumpalustris]